LKPYRLDLPPRNREPRQNLIVAFSNNRRKERRFLSGLKAGVSAPNV